MTQFLLQVTDLEVKKEVSLKMKTNEVPLVRQPPGQTNSLNSEALLQKTYQLLIQNKLSSPWICIVHLISHAFYTFIEHFL